MARKAKSTAVAARKSTAVVSAADVENWERELAKHAEEDAERLGTGGSGAISIRNSRFKYMGEDLGGDSINVIVLDFVHTRRYYTDEFDEDEVKPPACAAVNLDGKNMVPFDNVPEKQSDACDTCWANQWGSSERRAKAKACGNGRRLIVIPAGEDYHTEDDPDLARLRLPVKTMRAWDDYVAKLKATTGMPCFGVITELSFDRDVDYPKLQFKALGKVEPSYGRTILAARERARQMLLTAPDFSANTDEDAPARPAKGKPGKPDKAKGKTAGKAIRQREEPPAKGKGRSKFS